MRERPYYEAYDERYKQVHSQSLQWFSDSPSPIVCEVISEFQLPQTAKMLEIGCGEGRDAFHLLSQGYDLLATDVSAQAIAFCRKKKPAYQARFRTLNCLTETLSQPFDFIYAVAVIHMLVPDEDRSGFYRFIARHLKPDGIALIGSMGDGSFERSSDIAAAFTLSERMHEGSGKTMHLAGTSCRVVSSATFVQEIESNGLTIVKQGITSVEPDFPVMMYAVVKNSQEK